MDPVLAVTRLGGAATAGQLAPLVTRRQLKEAVLAGRLVHPFWGGYALPSTPSAVAAAARFAAVVSHHSAAELWRCEMLQPPDRVHLTVPSSRRLKAPRGVVVHHSDLCERDVIDRPWRLTALARTVIDCARTLPLAEAVVIGDSALRRGTVNLFGTLDATTLEELRRRAVKLKGPGAGRARKALALLDPRAESVLESIFRVLVFLAGFPRPRTQVHLIGDQIRVDFLWSNAHLVVEVEGYEFHSSRASWLNDCRRVNKLTVGGYRVLRFAWEDVVHGQEYVISTLSAALAGTGLPRVAPLRDAA